MDRVDGGMDEEIYGMAADFAMRMEVVLSVRIGSSGMLCHLDSLTVTLYLMSDIYIRC